jgi:RNA polymerase sigma-70 factor (ECF subfamily)
MKDRVADLELLDQASRGDGHAFAQLYDMHRDRVFRHVFRLSPSVEDAEDIVGIVFVIAWRKRSRIRVVDDSILPWLLTTASNVARNEARSRRRFRSFLARLPEPEITPDHAEAVLDEIAQEHDAQTIHRALQQLTPRDREILVLCTLEELSTAEALGIPVGTAKSRLSRAKSRLASILSDHEFISVRST